jgi:uncharacterized protein YjbJ (UPF0337 family)
MATGPSHCRNYRPLRLAASLVDIYPATEKIMDEHRATGTAKNLGGKIEEGIGRIAGDMQTQAKSRSRKLLSRMNHL